MGQLVLYVMSQVGKGTDRVFRCCGFGQVSVHGDDPSEVTPGQFRRFLVDSPLIRETIGGKIVRPRKSLTRRGPSSRSAVTLDDESKVLRLCFFLMFLSFSFAFYWRRV